ncbi:hypothetical protein [Geopsychrobacter electrodiphilus]|uniref:hypothetical protein n=1 Tax=Geopsychrobacter electrodiphilus TaxID=225196 RepID=UPI0003735CA8|nr:hypothetical protein [Geopsychrobacter electrodiphilus]
MTLLERLGHEEGILGKFEKVNDQRQDAWNNGLSTVREELKNESSSYLAEERTRCAKIAELSRTKMLG